MLFSPRSAHNPHMNTDRTLTQIIVGALLSGGVAVAGLGLGMSAGYCSCLQRRLWSMRLRSESLVPRRLVVYGSGWPVPGCPVGYGCLPYLVSGWPLARAMFPRGHIIRVTCGRGRILHRPRLLRLLRLQDLLRRAYLSSTACPGCKRCQVPAGSRKWQL